MDGVDRAIRVALLAGLCMTGCECRGAIRAPRVDTAEPPALGGESPPPPAEIPAGAWWERGDAACPDGGSLAGGMPPEHAAVWCALPNGDRHGPYARWRAGAGRQLGEQGSFHRARKHGLWITYGAAGERNEQGYRLDVPHGPWVSYHANGKKAAEGAFLDGLMHGVSRQWSDDGTLRVDGSYDKGSKVGTWRYFDETGALTNERRYDP